ncbi:MAG: cell division protein ZapB [Candidatus Adiutrix sp.]|jgi:septal ring factor EnvC (AmiA/AmiB activator)|nr:cell division protein ZapB [Candidatus Adiutrix sp.]
MDLTKLAELENRVNAMLDRLAALTKNNEKLQAELSETKNGLQETQADLDAAEALIKELQAEREAILDRVDTIIQRLD